VRHLLAKCTINAGLLNQALGDFVHQIPTNQNKGPLVRLLTKIPPYPYATPDQTCPTVEFIKLAIEQDKQLIEDAMVTIRNVGLDYNEQQAKAADKTTDAVGLGVGTVDRGGFVSAGELAATNKGDAGDQSDVRCGRLTKEDSTTKQTLLLATIRQHPTMKDDPAKLAEYVGASVSTVRRWLKKEEGTYRENKVAEASKTIVKCKHCGDGISGTEECPNCQEILPDECLECHGELCRNK
jgi:hypothetical protein